ncbi:MAG: hypothetical protein KGD63_14065 [Candidatus Lokiarchaeota archaeon]|nr:hypothetical protein [Candidatus Lokiarchaeota archaeon]
MASSQLPKDTFWIYQFIEKFSHFFIKITFKNTLASADKIKFNLKLKLEGFNGILFYIYKSDADKINFDLLNHPMDQMHNVNDLLFTPKEDSNKVLDFFVIPFGRFKNDNQISLIISSADFQVKFKFYIWTPSLLFKNIKSIIRINNQYIELEPIYKGHNNFYQVENWFKANDNSAIFQMINLLTEVDEYCGIDNIKSLISRSNELVFKKPKDQIIEIINDLVELKNKAIDMSKDEIINSIKDMVNFYSNEE